MNWVWSLSFLPLTLVTSSQIKVSPAANRSIAGVSQVSFINDDNKLSYAFNASEAREVCSTLRRTLASHAQVQNALAQGLETCRFGWVDEHFAVIPRIKASTVCGKNQTGLVKWRAPVTDFFDAFCFDESDIVIQLEDTTDSPSSTGDHDDATPPTSDPKPRFTSQTVNVVYSAHSTSPTPSAHLADSTSSTNSPQPSPDSTDTASKQLRDPVVVPTRALLIVSSCVLLLTLISILGYVKLNKICFLNWDVKHQEEAEEWTSMKHVNVKEAQKHTQEEVTIEMDNTTS